MEGVGGWWCISSYGLVLFQFHRAFWRGDFSQKHTVVIPYLYLQEAEDDF